MRKFVRSDRGGTLMLALGITMVIAVMLSPLLLIMNNGQLQAVTDANYERANAKAESMSLVFQQLLLEDADRITSREILDGWKANLDTQLSFCADSDMQMTDTGATTLVVKISCTNGQGASARTSTFQFQLNFNPSGGGGGGGGGGEPGPGENSNGTEFYHINSVVTGYLNAAQAAIFNDVFSVCGSPNTQGLNFVANTYNTTQYQEEFANYVDYYIGNNFDTRVASRPMPLAQLSVPAKVTAISNTVTQSDLTSNTSNGVRHAGNVRLTNSTVNALNDGSGSSVEAAGNVTWGDWLGNLTLNGNVKAGGNVTADKFTTLIVQGDMLSRGSITFNNGNWSDEVTINGDLIASGNITFHGVRKITVKGSIIAGGTFTVNNALDNGFVVEGSISAQNIYLNTNSSGAMSVGKWTSGGQPDNGDSQSIIAGNILHFQQMSNLRVTGDISAASTPNNFYVTALRTGGSLITNSALTIQIMNTWTIGGSLSAGGAVTLNNGASTLVLGQTLYATGNITFLSGVNLTIGGSILSGGQMRFQNVVTQLRVGGDVILKGTLTFADAASNIDIEGSLVASGSITFSNTVSGIDVEGDFLSGGSLSFQAINTSLQVTGILGVSGNMTFNNQLENSSNQLGGYYVGGSTSFPNWYQDYNNDGRIDNGNDAICINHNPPPVGGGSGGTAKISFGSWKSGD